MLNETETNVKVTATIFAIMLMLIIPSASAQGSWYIQRHVIGTTGATSAQIWGTMGQPVAGWITDRLCSGFWCGYASVTATIVGVATVLAHYTFGDVAIGAMILITLALVGSRGIYDVVRQVWVQRQSRSRPARSS
jgi:hypothetical protein